jgi:hypothetical protein
VFALRVQPAYATVGDGISHAWNWMLETWPKWLPVAVTVGLAGLVVYAAIDTKMADLYRTDPETGRMVAAPGWEREVPGLVAASLLVGAVQAIAGWYFLALAIGGLRNRPVTTAYVIGRGLVALWSSIVVAFAVGLVAAFGLLVAVVTMPLGALLLMAGIVGLLYVGIRLTFSGLAIFDGRGPIEGLKVSWSLSEQSVLRVFGWVLVGSLIVLAFGLVAAIFSALLQAGAYPVAQGISLAFEEAGSLFIIFMTAVLYESQRARLDPSFYPTGPLPYPTYPGPMGPYAGPYPGPYPQAPYPPAASPPGQWPSGAYPPYPYPPYPPAGPSQPSANQAAPPPPAPSWPVEPRPDSGPAWVSSEPEAPPPQPPKPGP